jgi:soluble lytic murein transglycosylase-like protein
VSYSTDYALTPAAGRDASAAAVARDIGSGALFVLRVLGTLIGCVALIAAAYVFGSEDARSRVQQVTPLAMAAWLGEHVAAAAEAVAIDSATGADETSALNDPQQRKVAAYLARRYRVADEAVQRIVSHAYAIGHEKKLDPLLILAVTAIESSLNPLAQSPVGAQGLMQVMTRVHSERFEPHGGAAAALDPLANLEVGADILSELIRRGGSVERGLQLYVGAGNLPDDGGYGAKVLAERQRLQSAAKAAAMSSAGTDKPVAKPSAPVPDRAG